MRVEHFDCRKGVGNLGRQQIAVLKADVGRRAFQMNIGPSALLEAIGLLQPGVGLAGGGQRRACQSQLKAKHVFLTHKWNKFHTGSLFMHQPVLLNSAASPSFGTQSRLFDTLAAP